MATTVSNVHYSRPLETMSIAYHPQGMMAESIFTVCPVKFEADIYYVWDRGANFRAIDDLRPDGVRAKSVDFKFSTDGYHTDEHALETYLTERERKNSDDPLQLEIAKVHGAQDLILLQQEIRIAALLANTANYATTNTTNVGSVATNQWNNASFTGSIEQYFDNGSEAIRVQLGGLQSNTIVIPKPVAKIVKRDALVRELIKYTHSDLLVDGDLPNKLWNHQVVIPGTSYTSSLEGAASVSLSEVWGKHAWVLYRTGAPSIGTVNFGYIFRVGGVSVKTWRDESIDTTFYRPAYNQVEKIVSPYAGYLLQNVIS